MKQGLSWNLARRLACGSCLAVFVTVVSTCTSTSALAGEGQGEYLTQASERLIKLVAKANADGYKLQNNSFSLGGGWLTQSQSTWVPLFTINMEVGKNYRCLAAGDNDAKDVDLQIVDPSGKVVAEDTGTNPQAVVNFSPRESGRHLIRLRLYESNKSLPCACLGIVTVK